MDRKSALAVFAAASIGAVVGATVNPSAADARKHVVVISDTDPTITHGDWRRGEDGGYRFTACGHVTTEDGGVIHLGPDCVPCEASAWTNGPAACLTAWKRANGIP